MKKNTQNNHLLLKRQHALERLFETTSSFGDDELEEGFVIPQTN